VYKLEEPIWFRFQGTKLEALVITSTTTPCTGLAPISSTTLYWLDAEDPLPEDVVKVCPKPTPQSKEIC
jgi:hypothetical protein